MVKIDRKDIEIMAPVGSFESLYATIGSGADAIYFGVGKLNMRAASSTNFTLSDISKISEVAHFHNVKSYLTLNTIIYDEDIDYMRQIVDCVRESCVDAIIASDWAVIDYALANNVRVHCSTQLNITNTSAVKYFSKFADVIVLARELNLSQVKEIHSFIEQNNITGPSGNLVKIEVFIHGALCMAISGKCYLSLHLSGKSANRGECLQLCRKLPIGGYIPNDREEEAFSACNSTDMTILAEHFDIQADRATEPGIIDNKLGTIMSPKDLCTIAFLDKILDAGARVLKIEGRGRSPEYVKRVCESYNIAIEHIIKGIYSDEIIATLQDRLSEVFNRGFWAGYYLGQTIGELTDRHGSSATKKKVFIGICTNYYSAKEIGEFLVQTNEISIGDDVLIMGPTTGVLELHVTELHNDAGATDRAIKGEHFAIIVPAKVRRNDKIYKFVVS